MVQIICTRGGKHCVMGTPGVEHMSTWWPGPGHLRRFNVCAGGDCSRGASVLARYSAKDELYYPATVIDESGSGGGVYRVKWLDKREDDSVGPVIQLIEDSGAAKPTEMALDSIADG